MLGYFVYLPGFFLKLPGQLLATNALKKKNLSCKFNLLESL